MIFKPKTGAMWDPSILWHDGLYYAFMMYNRDGNNGLEAQHCMLATSEDGVHWIDRGIVNEERDSKNGGMFFKCFVGQCGDRFIMDHGVARKEGQDIIRFYESTDLKNWKYLFSNSPDPRWYGVPPDQHRWDHMYILPKEEGTGYWGHPVACAKKGAPRGVGMMQSMDGREWEILPPAKVEWGDIPPKDLEWGGCERFGKGYYLIGGYGNYICRGYSMYVLKADSPTGPFRPDAKTYRLCGSSTHNVSWLAVWCRGNGELLISNYMSMNDQDRAPSMLPLRKPVVDADGHLRLGWWQGNEALKAQAVPLAVDRVIVDAASSGQATEILNHNFDLVKGVVMEGTICAHASGKAEAGFIFEEKDAQMALLLGVGGPDPKGEGRETRIGRLKDGGELDCEDIIGAGDAMVTGIEESKEHSFRLLIRQEAFELYIDDMLVQTFVYKPSSGRIGFIAQNAKVEFKELKVWEMDM